MGRYPVKRQGPHEVGGPRDEHEVQRRFEALLAGSADLVVVFDADGWLIYQSPNMASVLGAPLLPGFHGLHGLAERSIVHPDDRPAIAADIDALTKQPAGSTIQFSVRLRHADGTWLRFEARVRNLLATPEINGVVLNLHDVSGWDAAEVRLGALLAQSSDVTAVLSGTGIVQYVSPSVTNWTGWHPHDLVGRFGTDLAHPDDRAGMQAAMALIDGDSAWVSTTFRIRARDGSWRTFDARMTDGRGLPAVGGIVLNARDVTELVSSEARAQALAKYSTDAVAVFADNGPCLYASPACAEVFGIAPEALVGHDRKEEMFHRDDLVRFLALIGRLRRAGAGATETLEYRVCGRDATGWRWVESRITNMVDHPHVGGWVVNTRDVNERHLALALLEHQANHDELTGLPNRRYLEARLIDALERGDGPVSLLFCDVDRFKLVNDVHGHGTGDAVLRAVAARLTTAAPGSLVARFAGDEFVVLSEDDGDGLAEKILAAFESPLPRSHGVPLHVRVSVGSALSTAGVDAAELLRRADIALYAAKAEGRNRHVAYSSGVADRNMARHQLEQELRRGLEEGELEVWYQPMVELRGERTVGVEALVRWRHPDRGLILPGEFVPLAEEIGLILLIDRQVLAAALAQARQWADAGCATPISVNLSAQDLTANLPAVLADLLDTYGVPACQLTIEVTETAAADCEAVVRCLNEVAQLGVGIAIDDFGTGYSTLAQLRRLPATALKVDGTFVNDLVEDRGARAIVAASVAMAQEFGVVVVAEHVQDEAQRDALLGLGVEIGQGELFAPPAPPCQLSGMAAGRPAGAPASDATADVGSADFASNSWVTPA